MKDLYLKFKDQYKRLANNKKPATPSASLPITEEVMTRLRWFKTEAPNGIHTNWEAIKSIAGSKDPRDFWCGVKVSFDVFDSDMQSLATVHNDRSKVRITASAIAEKYKCQL